MPYNTPTLGFKRDLEGNLRQVRRGGRFTTERQNTERKITERAEWITSSKEIATLMALIPKGEGVFYIYIYIYINIVSRKAFKCFQCSSIDLGKIRTSSM